jgi:hypothetical protein
MLKFVRWLGNNARVQCDCGRQFTVPPAEFIDGVVRECPTCADRAAWLLLSLRDSSSDAPMAVASAMPDEAESP